MTNHFFLRTDYYLENIPPTFLSEMESAVNIVECLKIYFTSYVRLSSCIKTLGFSEDLKHVQFWHSWYEAHISLTRSDISIIFYFLIVFVVTLQPELGWNVTEVVVLLINLMFNNCSLILGHLYAYYLIPYRSPIRQTG